MSLRIYGNRSLQTLPGLSTRPTPARVRQAVFNILQGQVQGSHWLDLCAGAGTMGAEALCRGARRVVGIEQSGAACRIVLANWSKLAQPEQTFQVIKGDAYRLISRWTGDRFDVIYFDPPYDAGLYATVLPLLPPVLSPTGVVIAEHRSSNPLPEKMGSLSSTDQRQYGQTELTFYRHFPDNYL